MFDRKDGCEYVFIWRTSEACPIRRVQGKMNSQFLFRTVIKHSCFNSVYFLFFTGQNCKVKDPKSGYEYNLTPLGGKDYDVKGLGYEYQFAVCGPITTSVCPHGPSNTVSSCQVEGQTHRIAGEFISFSVLVGVVLLFFFSTFNLSHAPLQG